MSRTSGGNVGGDGRGAWVAALRGVTDVLREALVGLDDDRGGSGGGGADVADAAAAPVDGRRLMGMPPAHAAAAAGGVEAALRHLRALEREVQEASSGGVDQSASREELQRIKTRKTQGSAQYAPIEVR